MIDALAQFLGIILNVIFNFIHDIGPAGSLGIAIILFTIFTRVLMLPLMINQQISMRRMQKIQPQIQKIQNKYKDKKDPESQKQMSKELGEFYKENKVNPLGGCLPLLIQMPIFFALFRVLQKASTYILKLHEIYNQLAVKIMETSGYQSILQDILKNKSNIKLDETVLNNVDSLQSVLSQLTSTEWGNLISSIKTIPESLIQQKDNIEIFLGISLVDSPKDLMGQGVIVAVVLFVFISAFTTYLQSKISVAGSSNQNEQAAQTQKTMSIIFPFITAWMTYSLPAGLGIYWITSNIFQIVQQIAINKYLDKTGEGE
ncbi:YidC/Oxa1 family membrane protein insertase [Defluviitalea phaphyphila]|uniref:YidC/Oxa1 family membrane protein insertase n=1 Tax=Defluviitalea phaphyphila TaxID=1473580 RepID=UPI00073059BE|nr:YidC/Oxa1 family membrane protein insertase [Defluviitalea phaphyphila]